jgi:hypothetical protein
MYIGCNRLGTVARDFYGRCCWHTERRITSWSSCVALC